MYKKILFTILLLVTMLPAITKSAHAEDSNNININAEVPAMSPSPTASPTVTPFSPGEELVEPEAYSSPTWIDIFTSCLGAKIMYALLAILVLFMLFSPLCLPKKNKINNFFNAIRYSVLIAGTIISVIFYIKWPVTFNLVVMLLYAGSWVWELLHAGKSSKLKTQISKP